MPCVGSSILWEPRPIPQGSQCARCSCILSPSHLPAPGRGCKDGRCSSQGSFLRPNAPNPQSFSEGIFTYSGCHPWPTFLFIVVLVSTRLDPEMGQEYLTEFTQILETQTMSLQPLALLTLQNSFPPIFLFALPH